MSTVVLVTILVAALLITVACGLYLYSWTENNADQVYFGSSWHYLGNTSMYFNDVCPDSGLPVPCVGWTGPNPPSTIEQWTNGITTAYVGRITYTQTYSVVIMNNATYCVAPKVSHEPGCPAVIR